MYPIAIILAFALAWWLLDRHNSRRERILGCTHERLEVRQVNPRYGGTLYFECPKRLGGCGYQAHLLCLKPLPNGQWHLEHGKDDTEKMLNWQKAYNEAAKK